MYHGQQIYRGRKRSRYVVNLYAVVLLRGVPVKSLYNLLGLSSKAVLSCIVERASIVAGRVGSYQIWLGSERSTSSDGEC